nr:RhuM family protein [Actinomyces bowdenii]
MGNVFRSGELESDAVIRKFRITATDGKVLPSDVAIGKNYLTSEELADLGRQVNAFLVLVDSRARRQILMTMEDWAKRLDAFLNLDDREILEGAGRISKT